MGLDLNVGCCVSEATAVDEYAVVADTTPESVEVVAGVGEATAVETEVLVSELLDVYEGRGEFDADPRSEFDLYTVAEGAAVFEPYVVAEGVAAALLEGDAEVVCEGLDGTVFDAVD